MLFGRSVCVRVFVGVPIRWSGTGELMSVCESYSVSFAATQPYDIYTYISVFIGLLIRHRTFIHKPGVRMHVVYSSAEIN